MRRQREYERTHPWLTFTADLRRASPRLWLLLGEASSKCEHIAGTPLKPAVNQELHKIYLIKGAQATTAIEGNTLTEDEIRRRMDGKLTLPPSREYLGQEVDNIVSGCEEIWDAAVKGQAHRIDVQHIRAYNATVLAHLELGPDVIPGQIRLHSVVVGNYQGAPAEDCEYLLGRLCDWLNGPEFCRTDSEAIVWGVVRAVLAHLYLAWIHPFGDGNGRTARLLEYRILVSAGVPSPAAHLLSNHYNQTRTEYYRKMDRSHRDRDGGVLSFLEYAVQGFVDGLREQLQWIQTQELDIAWRDYVYTAFAGRTTPVDTRRRELVLALAARGDAVPVQEVRRLTPALAEAYASRTSRTLARDIDEVIEMGLVVSDGKGVRANREVMFAFMPARRVHDDP